jgi:hypothetical protein
MPEANKGEAADKVAQGDWAKLSDVFQEVSILRGEVAALL